MSRYLGLDASTQSLSALVVDTESGEIVLDETVSFGEDLPHYNSPNGFLPNDDPLVKQSDPAMWVEALDLLLARCRENGFDWGTIDGLSGSGQQHGSVYLNDNYEPAIWDPGRPLADQLRPLFSRPVAPIWMDSSTSDECREIAAAVGPDRVVQISGSRAIERFTGPQIRRFHKEDPKAYRLTARVHLVSSFMAYLMCGHDVPIDYGDGAGMNLLDLSAGAWSEPLMEATAPKLPDKLPGVGPSEQLVGTVADYFAIRYGFAPATPVVAWSGDNPNSLVGMGAIEPGTAVISLGTSDTCFAAMSEPCTDPAGYGHVFGNPAGGFMCLICFKNGSLAREEVRQRFDLSWDDFSRAILEETSPGNDGNLMLYYFVPEITPRILHETVELVGSDDFVAWRDSAAAARAIVEAQAVSMRLHSRWIGEQPTTILVTGGASQNPAILQVLADVFQAELMPLSVSNSAALGAALRAAHAAGDHDWETLFEQFAAPDRSRMAKPDPATASVYDELTERYAELLAPRIG